MQTKIKAGNLLTKKVSEAKFINPREILRKIGMFSGMKIADFGCGPGYFSFEAAKIVGEGGMVFALDVLPQVIEVIESQIKVKGITNVSARRVNIEKIGGSKLSPESVDWIIMKDVMFQNQNKEDMLKEANRILKKGGKVLIIEWLKETKGIGPDSELRISKEDLKDLVSKAGFLVNKEVGVGDFHYGLILEK